jgi:hypothetical protein
MNNHTPSASEGDALHRSAQLCKDPREVSQQRKGRSMTVIITKTKLALGILAMVLVGATVVAAGDGVFTDNPSGTYYHDPVEWAYENGITTGTSDTTFSPMDPVTRGQNVTFAYRYDQNIVQPAFETIDDNFEIVDDNFEAAASDVSDIEATIANLPDVYFIEVDADGTKTQGSFGTSAQKVFTGSYEVTFPVDDVNDCTWSATIAEKADGDSWGTSDPEGMIYLQDRLGSGVRDVDAIFVSTHQTDGTTADRPFMIQITCGLPVGFYFPPIEPIVIIP